MVTKAARTDAILGRLVDEQLRARGLEFEDDVMPERRKTLYQRRQSTLEQHQDHAEKRADHGMDSGQWEGSSWTIPTRLSLKQRLTRSLHQLLPQRNREIAPSKRITIGLCVAIGCVLAWFLLHGQSNPHTATLDIAGETSESPSSAVGTVDIELQSTATSTLPTGFDEEHLERLGSDEEVGTATNPPLEPIVQQEPTTMFVHIAGGVASPGVVELHAGSRVVDAVRAAGGLLPSADADRVNLAAPLQDGLRIVVPLIGQDVPSEVPLMQPPNTSSNPGSSTPSGHRGGTDSNASAANGKVNINTASVTDLDTLPGIGPATASVIVAHREQHGPFPSVESLMEVRGIGQAKLDSLRDLITI